MVKAILKDVQKIKSIPKELREFGVVMGVASALLGGLLWWRHRHYLIPGILSACFLSIGFIAPKALLPFQKAWMTIAVIIGFFMSRVILSITFFLVLTPLAVLSRISGSKHLNLNFRTDEPSYWILKKQPFSKDRYEKQY